LNSTSGERQAVRADDDVHLAARFSFFEHLALLLRRAEAGERLDADGEAGEPLGEAAQVLLGEDRGRHEHRHLLAVLHRLERGADRDLGLAVADVAADQPVHRPDRLHVAA
jgi:hypothetical protein